MRLIFNVLLFSFVIIFLAFPRFSYANYEQREKVDNVLNTANAFFEKMQKHDFADLWNFLSNKSKDKIVTNVYKNLLKSKIQGYSENQIRQDFKNDGPIAQSFWTGYLKTFNPNMVLNESVWEKVEFDGKKAKIVIKYKKASEPFYLQMVKENGDWKVGLIETFGI
ncbi:MAG: hypothetical protein QXU98_05770 [Candidatus Parvarchaeota archaeon]